MKPDSEELRQRMDCFREGIRRAGVKLTHQRLEIFHELAKSGSHPHAEAIYRGVRKRMPSISLDTVYRTLWMLLDLRLISALGSRDRVRFDGNMKSHHHFICMKCGLTCDLYDEDYDRLKIPKDVKRFGSVEKTQVELKGLCLRCERKPRK